jgi:hypothetical protein
VRNNLVRVAAPNNVLRAEDSVSFVSGSQNGLHNSMGGKNYMEGAKRKGGSRGALEVGLSERVVWLFTTEVTSDQTLGN